MCEDFSVLLSAYVDDEVTPSERAQVEAHLAGCVGCRAELKALQQATRFAALLPEILPPADLRMQILARTVNRRSPWERVRDAVANPGVWRPALATVGSAGLAGVLIYAALSGKSHQQIAGIAPALPPVRSGVKRIPPAIPSQNTHPTEIAKLPKEPGRSFKADVKGWLEKVQEALTPGPSSDTPETVAFAPRETGAGQAVKGPVHEAAFTAKTPKAIPAVVAATHKPQATVLKPASKPSRSGVPPVKAIRTLPKVNSAPTSEPPAEEMPMPAPDRPMYAAGMPSGDTERAVQMNTADPDEPKRELDTKNPLVEGLKMLASVKPERKEDPTQEMVQKLNATLNASALSTARQVKWDIGKIKF